MTADHYCRLITTGHQRKTSKDGNGAVLGRISAGFGSSGFGFGLDFSPTVFGFGAPKLIGFGFRSGFSLVDIQWITEISHYELKFMFYYILIIRFYLYTILSWVMKLFTILLPLIYTCEYVYICAYFYKSLDCSSYVAIRSGFRVSNRVSDIHGFGFGHEFSPEAVFGLASGFKFLFRFWVPRHSTWSEPNPLPSLKTRGSSGLEGRWHWGIRSCYHSSLFCMFRHCCRPALSM
jgi:hypothetical protein